MVLILGVVYKAFQIWSFTAQTSQISFGITQGSISGPVFFVFSWFPRESFLNFHFYTDDAEIFVLSYPDFLMQTSSESNSQRVRCRLSFCSIDGTFSATVLYLSLALALHTCSTVHFICDGLVSFINM